MTSTFLTQGLSPLLAKAYRRSFDRLTAKGDAAKDLASLFIITQRLVTALNATEQTQKSWFTLAQDTSLCLMKWKIHLTESTYDLSPEDAQSLMGQCLSLCHVDMDSRMNALASQVCFALVRAHQSAFLFHVTTITKAIENLQGVAIPAAFLAATRFVICEHQKSGSGDEAIQSFWQDSISWRDGLFARSQLLRAIERDALLQRFFVQNYAAYSQDSMPLVRKTMFSVMSGQANLWKPLQRSLLLENDPKVMASAIISMHKSLGASIPEDAFIDQWLLYWTPDSPVIVLRAIFQEFARHAEVFGLSSSAIARVREHGEAFSAESPNPSSINEWQQLDLTIEVFSVRKLHDLALGLKAHINSIKPGSSKSLASTWLRQFPEDDIILCLNFLAQTDHGFDIEVFRRSWRIHRGHKFQFRWWRFLYEMRVPQAAKRQGFTHSIGRGFKGSLRIPSGILCELAETQVPGEPLFIKEEAGWRPYLPLVDDCISVVNPLFFPKKTVMYSHAGATEISFQGRRLKQWKAWFHLTWNFKEWSSLRNWNEDQPHAPGTYLNKLQNLGFHFHLSAPIHRVPTAATSEQSAPMSAKIPQKITRFFPAFLPLGSWNVADNFFDFFGKHADLYSNSLFDLAGFMALLLVAFLSIHLFRNARFRIARRSLGCVVGGWGSRGKSGTERLKAALFNSMGFSVVSKTTGCEAMLVVSEPFGKLQELPLFRPGGKTTIWEQTDVVRTASSWNADVFLWECMGLNPEYVTILQRRWMRDDISTLTNAYPDHEDIQGPAGVNIPQTMTRFIPSDSHLLTTEDYMLPILRQGALEAGTSFQAVSLLEADLITDDVLKRFPYEEHHRNIQLAVDLAHHFGVGIEQAYKELADRVVPDIGVLKIYPDIVQSGRSISFANGFSANERHGTMGNWSRLGYDVESVEDKPENWVSVLVNNRADRLARSVVFADVMVRDLSVDTYFLMGTNLDGLCGYTRQAWSSFQKEIDLYPEREGTDSHHLVSLEALQVFCRRFRVPFTDEILKKRLGFHKGERTAAGYAENLEKVFAEMLALKESLIVLGPQPSTAQRHEANIKARTLFGNWFLSKIVVVPEEIQTSGLTMAAFFGEATPLGYYHRMMGIQNIKGPGLVWLSDLEQWFLCQNMLHKIRAEQGVVQQRALAELAAVPFSAHPFCRDAVQEVLNSISPALRDTSWDTISHMVTQSHRGILPPPAFGIKPPAEEPKGFFGACRKLIEEFREPSQTAFRRREATRIYKKLAKGTMDFDEARAILREYSTI